MLEEERSRLKKIYEDMSDEGLMERLLEGKESYQEGVYELILEEARQRGIDRIVEEAKKTEKEERINRDRNWVAVYRFSDNLAGHTLEVMLKERNIPSAVVSLYDSAYDGLLNKAPYGAGVIKVREDYVEEARKIIADFETQREKKGNENG